MKKLLLVIPLVLFLHSCDQQGDAYGQEGTREISLDQLQEKNDIFYASNEDTPFTGRVTEYFANGKLSLEEIYMNGKLDGLKRKWYENGQLMSELPYVNGLINGMWNTWYENGILKSETPYVNGQKEGWGRTWREDGKLYSTKMYGNKKTGN